MVEFKNVRNNMANRKIHVCLIALIWSLGKQVGKVSKKLMIHYSFLQVSQGFTRPGEKKNHAKFRPQI